MDEKEQLEEIKNNLSLDQIEDLLTSLGGEPYRQNEIIISRTICHCGESHKLFYYDNTKLFRCYTECSEIFDVFQLVMKVHESAGTKMVLPQALSYILKFFNISMPGQQEFELLDDLADWKILNRYNKNDKEEKEKQIIELKIFDEQILKYLPRPHILPWENEGITKEVCDFHNICYNPSSQAIIIPHYNKDNELVGIRERTLIKENEQFGKYRPAYLNRKMYNHPLGFNLFNLNNSKDNIKKIKKVIVFEGEKSPLLYASYFGQENDITVACCGSSLGSYQIDLLKELGVDEIIIAFDKQFKEIGDDEWKGWTKKLKQIHQKYGSTVQISYLFDKQNLLGYKDSPIDCGKEVFLKLFKERVRL